MTVSLMSLLGGNVVLSANGGGNADEAGNVTLTSNGDAAFETVMAAKELQDISAENLRAYFQKHGIKIPEGLPGQETAGEILARIVSMQNGKKLPGDMLMVLQEFLPEEAFAQMNQEFGVDMDVDVAAQFAWMDLPDRELTPEELSELVQETGLPPVVIFAALQNTPAASPNLAAAMVEGESGLDMEAYQRMLDAQGQQQTGDAQQQANMQAIADMMQEGMSRREAAELSAQLSGIDFAALGMDRQDVLKRISAALRGEKTQAEFDWGARVIAANNNTQQVTQAQASQAAEAANAADAHIADDLLAQQPVGKGVSQSSQNAAEAAIKALADNGNQNAAPIRNAAADAAGSTQQANFAATLESTTALRHAHNAAPVDAQLRQPATHGPVTEQVEVHIRTALADGSRRMEIHLKPAELGRVDVRIETDADGRSHVTVTADKRDALDMLQRDARALERALNDAGLKTDSNSLSFNLRGEEQQQAKSQQQDDNHKPAFDLNGEYADDLDAKLDTSEMALTYDAGRAYRLNLDWGVDISV